MDWEKVAKLGKFKDVRSARGSVDYLLKKVIPNKDNEGDGTVADPSSPVAEKTTARKRKSGAFIPGMLTESTMADVLYRRR